VLLAAAVTALSPGAAAADEVPITEEARTHFSAGVALLKDPKEPRYEEAYREFRAAYAASPSYKILGNLGLCAMKIERDAEAIKAFETYLAAAGPELRTDEREQIERDLLTLRTGITHVTVSSEPPGALISDERIPVQGAPVHNNYGEVSAPMDLGLRRGHHVVRAKLAGYQDAEWDFDAAGGETLPPHVFHLQKNASATLDVTPRVSERPIPTAAYVVGGVSGALLLTGMIFGVLAINERSHFASVNDGTRVQEASDSRSKGKTLNLVTDVLLGAGVVGAGVTAYLVLARPTVERRVGLRPRVVPVWGGGGAGATAVWQF
jgi:hypothetical protein